ncbi:hypothetical protein BB560_005328 [Smittium megazygosporum]|uniref:Uncharacterized protein n=1 Tax=Smittium megazygosporum TaxID=133381 RepID=A0A2T9Z6X2_9FUNG|nr:hypothetical protein BB560_005328 [Smittium megazygosporum]
MYCINIKQTARHYTTPFVAMFGRHENDFIYYSEVTSSNQEENAEAYIKERVEYINNILFPSINTLTKKSTKNVRDKFNSKHKMVDIKPGTFVMIRKDIKPNKLDTLNDGPYKVLKKIDKDAYVLQGQIENLLGRNYTPSQIIEETSKQITTNPVILN